MEESHHGHHHGAWSQAELERLNRPDRAQLMPKEPVLDKIGAMPGSWVADVGAGLGWLTFPLALQVGQAGLVVAIEPSAAGIDAIRQRALREQLPQVDARVAAAENTGLGDGTVDRVVWHTMYHDISDRAAALREMHRILKPHGLWIIVDWEKRPMADGPPYAVRFHPQEVRGEVEAMGFRVVEQWSAGPVTWGLTVEKP